MSSLNRTQKIVLLVLAVLDFVVIAGMGWIVISSTRASAQAPPAPPLATATKVPVATWTPTPTMTPRPTLPARLTNTPAPTTTPVPTVTPSPTFTPMPPAPVELEGADFDYVLPNRIPGWSWDAYVNYKGGDDYSTESSYAEPLFTAADDPQRQINGATLKIETIRWLKFRAWVHQTVTVTAGSQATFQIRSEAFSSLDTLIVRAGIDPKGAPNCNSARWGQEMRINQDSGIVTLKSPTVLVQPVSEPSEGEETPQPSTVGRVTVCFFAEPAYPHINNAAFFDMARLTVSPPR